MAVFPLVEDIEGEGDATVYHQLRAASHADGRDQADAMGAPFVDVEDIGLVPPHVFSQFRRRSGVQWASKREFEERETCVGTVRLEITAGAAPDPHLMSSQGKAFGCRQHLNHRPGVQLVFVNQVKDAKHV